MYIRCEVRESQNENSKKRNSRKERDQSPLGKSQQEIGHIKYLEQDAIAIIKQVSHPVTGKVKYKSNALMMYNGVNDGERLAEATRKEKTRLKNQAADEEIEKRKGEKEEMVNGKEGKGGEK